MQLVSNTKNNPLITSYHLQPICFCSVHKGVRMSEDALYYVQYEKFLFSLSLPDG